MKDSVQIDPSIAKNSEIITYLRLDNMATNPPHIALDESQFEQLFKLHFQFLCNFARQYVEDPDTAQDITQKVFIALWEKRAEIDPRLSVKAY